MAGSASFEFDPSQVNELARDLGKAAVSSGARAYKLIRHHGMRLQAQVKANASGRPGPRIQTGDYNRSIGLMVGIEGGGPIARVGTNRPQGRRLEKGFVGTDDAGRTFNQPPFPHFGPAVDQVGLAFERDVLDEMMKVFGR